MEKISDYKYIIPMTGKMRTEGLIFADERIIEDIKRDNAQQQVANVATLGGIVGKSMAMPDIHYGYGFPIGGVAAFDTEKGVISPGGIGYDINCGVRLLRTSITENDLKEEDIKGLCKEIYENVPAGVGCTGKIKLQKKDVKNVLKNGAAWAVKNGYGKVADLEFTEEEGCMKGAEPEFVSERALERGQQQVGTLGAGNHFIEIQKVSDIYDEQAAQCYGIKKGQITIMIHTGSRGLGYQICEDYLKVMRTAVAKYKIDLVDRQLACAPFNSEEGQRYFSAMQCGANYAWANRQCIMHWIRESAEKILGISAEIELVYDVCHNVGKVEEYKGKKLIVHRKGATRAFGPGRKELPERYMETGQPVIIPGTMGTSSYLSKGTSMAMEESFGSTCHGAGRVWSRTRALKTVNGHQIIADLKEKGIFVMAKSTKTVAEEAPQAYKDVSHVVDICHNAGISRKVARFIPLAVIKG
ncbi:MAG: RtcB family protein [Elusimicrobiota bacterium]